MKKPRESKGVIIIKVSIAAYFIMVLWTTALWCFFLRDINIFIDYVYAFAGPILGTIGIIAAVVWLSLEDDY